MEKNFTRADFLPEFFENVLVVEGMWAMLFSTLDDDDDDAFVAKVREDLSPSSTDCFEEYGQSPVPRQFLPLTG